MRSATCTGHAQCHPCPPPGGHAGSTCKTVMPGLDVRAAPREAPTGLKDNRGGGKLGLDPHREEPGRSWKADLSACC